MVAELERKAEQCRRLAASITDRIVAERLTTLAEEYEAKAAETDSREHPSITGYQK